MVPRCALFPAFKVPDDPKHPIWYHHEAFSHSPPGRPLPSLEASHPEYLTLAVVLFHLPSGIKGMQNRVREAAL